MLTYLIRTYGPKNDVFMLWQLIDGSKQDKV
jgi:hypothetical protein